MQISHHFSKCEIHLSLPKGRQNTRNHSHKAYPLSECGMPKIKLYDCLKRQRILKIYKVLEWLNVEETNRYSPTDTLTFCNIYAHDFAYLLGAYIPRVWWHQDILSNKFPATDLEIKYGKTVFEQNCNALFQWFQTNALYFNFLQAEDVNYLQNKINKGTIGVIVSRTIEKNKSGHISIVIPEYINNYAKRTQDIVVSPLQTQAGRKNNKIFSDNWWESENSLYETNFWIWNI